MRNTYKLIFLGFLLSLSFFAMAQPAIVFKEGDQPFYIGKQSAVYQDSSHSKNFNQVKANAALFSPSKSEVPNFGISGFNNWMRFKVANRSNQNTIVLNLESPQINLVKLYTVHADHRIDSVSLSESTPVRDRLFRHQFFIFDIPVRPGEEVTCYLMLNSTKQVLAPVTLQDHEGILSFVSNTDTLSGIYFGIMLVMLLYNLFIYISVRDKSYLVYVNYIFWVTLTQATLLGYGHRFIWTDSAWLSHNMVTICGALVGIATISFSRSFLHTSIYYTRIHPALNLLYGGYILALILIFAGYPTISYHIVDAMAGLGALLILFTGYKVAKKKYKPARYFLVAWTIFLVSVFLFVMKDYGILPYNFLTVHSLQLGSAIEAVLLSFALADRINTLKKEKEASQEQALQAAKENERIIREQNVILELKVTERTRELNQANQDLSQTLVELKEAEASLVESEKMASLGQLTAGIAHEINNPINFVTSNIIPLRRDVDMLLESIDFIEKVGLSDLSQDKKQHEINEFKEELDFDYLKIEINQLLKGIDEGASRTAEIVKGLRIFSRLDEDDLKKADINEGLDSTIVIINNLLSDKIRIIKDYGNIPVIECYPGKLNQVFLNIISNAIFAISERHGDNKGGEILISTSTEAGKVFVKIKDNGTGMDEATRKKIFEPFFTTKDVGQGTGLGMSIAFNTIRKHQGEIHVQSSPGVGTEFILELPIYLDISQNF